VKKGVDKVEKKGKEFKKKAKVSSSYSKSVSGAHAEMIGGARRGGDRRWSILGEDEGRGSAPRLTWWPYGRQ
jgi:hypothetical protein